MPDIKIGQRWISEMEPELGLGIVTALEDRTVRIYYPAGECERQYAIQSAPIRRVQFAEGDTISSVEGNSYIVRAVEEREGIFYYLFDTGEIPETRLSDALSFTTPKDRLLSGMVDDNRLFNLRQETLSYQAELTQSPVFGFAGARIDLIPHQLYVAGEVARRPSPRVLLADEVGLGKTIEACLILHRLLLTGRIVRVLILVPESLLHQWFVELLRKFNLSFRIIDNDFAESLSPDNPFELESLCLCSMEHLSDEKKLGNFVLASEWDMVVVDEAHHLTENSPDYRLVEQLGSNSPGLILITATPQQLGHRSHFARLSLLDPARYSDFKRFEKETTEYEAVAQIVSKLLENKPLSVKEKQNLSRWIPHASEFTSDQLINKLLDRHGPGRVMFRNTRRTLSGFPKRQVHLIELECETPTVSSLRTEFESEPTALDLNNDPRIEWLAGFFRSFKTEKILLICASVEKVKAINLALRSKIQVDTALFHEELNLLQRDKNAAWFAQEQGARILLCSEIGSEGRNFQFVHHLVLFDLPLDPEKLEQRIGRLDRIGQRKTIHIHVPFLLGTPQEGLVRWYHEGLDAFETQPVGAYEIAQKMGEKLRVQLMSGSLDADFLTAVREESFKMSRLLESGRDRLLEKHSFDSEKAGILVRDIQQADQGKGLEVYATRLFEAFGIQVEDVDGLRKHLRFELLKDPSFPLPPMRDDQVFATFNRTEANHHEDIEFLSRDHPMISGAMELMLGSEKGNCSLALWPGENEQNMLLETLFVLECVAPARLFSGRFLPPTPIRIVVDHQLEDLTGTIPSGHLKKCLKGSPPEHLIKNPGVKAVIPRMIHAAGSLAERRADPIKKNGLENMQATLGSEIDRLTALKKVNPNVRDVEIKILESEKQALERAIDSARLRLDAIRLIVKV